MCCKVTGNGPVRATLRWSTLMQKTTFTLGEAAELLSCHKETLRRAIKDGALRAARLGRGYRISRIDLEAFWTAQGGGELFGETVGEDQPVSPAQPREEKRRKEPTGPRQLTLPTS